MGTSVRSWSARLTELGPWFGGQLLPDPVPAGWRPAGEVVADRAWLARLAVDYRTALTATFGGPAAAHPVVEDRVAGSTAQLAVLGRVLSPAVASVALVGRTPRWDRALWVRADDHRVDTALDLAAVGDPAGWSTDLSEVLEQLARPLAEACRPLGPLALGILAGNTASALRGAVNALRYADPALADRAAEPVRAALQLPDLAGAWSDDDGTWRRRSCCLFYRLPGSGLCGDCVLRRVPTRSG